MSLVVKSSLDFHCFMIQKNIMNIYKDKYYLNTVVVIQMGHFFLGRTNECHHLIVFIDFPFIDAKVNVQINIFKDAFVCLFFFLLSSLPVTVLKHNERRPFYSLRKD